MSGGRKLSYEEKRDWLRVYAEAERLVRALELLIDVAEPIVAVVARLTDREHGDYELDKIRGKLHERMADAVGRLLKPEYGTV